PGENVSVPGHGRHEIWIKVERAFKAAERERELSPAVMDLANPEIRDLRTGLQFDCALQKLLRPIELVSSILLDGNEIGPPGEELGGNTDQSGHRFWVEPQCRFKRSNRL